MQIIKILLLVVVASSLHSCGYSDEFKEINHDEQFVISFPDYMESCEDFGADVNYKNSYRNTYSLVNVYDKEGRTLQEFQKEVLGLLKGYELLNDPLITDSVYRETDSFSAIDVQLYGIMDNQNIYYWHSAFESEGQFFEVVCWTRSMDRKQRYGPDLEKVLASFKPLV
jgi:hypothetical protein